MRHVKLKRWQAVHLTAAAALAGVGLYTSSCKDKKRLLEATPSAYIIGPNNIAPVDDHTIDQVSAAPVKASVLIATKLKSGNIKFCSGTLVEPEGNGNQLRVLTNHHCFAKMTADEKATTELIPEACDKTTIYFGFAPKIAEDTHQSRCEKGSLKTSFDGDLAVFSLTANPPDEFHPAALWDGDPAPADRAAFIIHYPNITDQLAVPRGEQIPLPTAQATIDDCKVIGPFEVADWDLDRTLPFSIRHTCDLIHGSSGSALFDRDTGKILGVNWGGLKVSYDKEVRTDNVATQASFAAAFLNSNTDSLLASARVTRANNAAAIQKNDQAAEKKKSSLAAGTKKACGRLDAVSLTGGFSFASYIGWLMLFSMPLAAVVCSRQKKSWNV